MISHNTMKNQAIKLEAIYRRYQLLAGVIITLLVASHITQTAFANESGLTLPKKPSEAVILALSSDYFQNTADDFLRVFVGDVEKCCEAKNPIAGEYQVDASSIRFVPRFEFSVGQNYVVQYKDATTAIATG